MEQSAAAPAAVDGHDVAGEVVARVGGEEDDGAFEVGGFAPAVGGDALEDFEGALGVGLEGGGVVGAHVAGGDGVDLDAVGGPFVGEGFGELADGALAGGVSGNRDAAEKREQGGDVDDFAGAAGDHVLAGGAAGDEDAVEVDVEDGVPVGVGVVDGGGAFDDAGVVDENVEVALPGDGLVDEALDGGAVGEVGGDGVGVEAVFREAVDDGGEFAGIAAVDDDVGAGLAEGAGHGEAESLGGTGDEGDLAAETELFLEEGVHGTEGR